MKRIILPAAVLAVLAMLLAGCTVNDGKVTVTDPPRVTANVTSSPAPATPTHAPTAPAVTPEGPGSGSEPDMGSGLTGGSGLDGRGSGAAGQTAAPGTQPGGKAG